MHFGSFRFGGTPWEERRFPAHTGGLVFVDFARTSRPISSVFTGGCSFETEVPRIRRTAECACEYDGIACAVLVCAPKWQFAYRHPWKGYARGAAVNRWFRTTTRGGRISGGSLSRRCSDVLEEASESRSVHPARKWLASDSEKRVCFRRNNNSFELANKGWGNCVIRTHTFFMILDGRQMHLWKH